MGGTPGISPYCQSASLVHIADSKLDLFSVRVSSLLFVDDVVLLASSNNDLQLTLGQFAAECVAAVMGISTSKCETIV